MPLSKRNQVLLLGGAAIAVALFYGTAGVGTAGAQQPRSVDAGVLRATGTTNDPFAGSWLSYGRTQGETRYSPLKQINAANAGQLGLEWTYVLGAGGGNQEGTPLVWNNTIYTITNWSVVHAVDAKTGQPKWRWDPEVAQNETRVKMCCGIVNRGLALSDGKIFAPVNDGRLLALDAMTGKPVWEARLAYPQDWYSVTMAPRVAGDKVVIGAAGGDHPTRGFFDAYDIKTGHRAWRFWTVPGDPAKPYENDAMKAAGKTWGGDFHKWGGGGAVWDGMAYDPEAGLIYVGTGNAEPWVQKFRGAQDMDNLYTCSILAVEVATGKLKWYYQAVPNDNWDFDNVQHLMLSDLRLNGRDRKVLMQAAKNGFFYVLDRLTGELLSAEPFALVNWADGVDLKTGRPRVRRGAFYDKDPVVIHPTAGGAHNWAPMSMNPATGLVYIPTTYATWTFVAGDEVVAAQTGHTGLGRGGQPKGDPMPTIGPAGIEGQRGILQAWDPVQGKRAWATPGGGGIGGGTSTTAGNLVFQTINDGRFLVYTADKGEKLYEVNVNRTGMGPPVTYEVDGKQYIAFQGGMGRPAQVVGPNDAKIDGAPMLFVFSLDGKQEMPAPPPPPQGRGGGKGKGGPPPPPPPPAKPAAEEPHN